MDTQEVPWPYFSTSSWVNCHHLCRFFSVSFFPQVLCQFSYYRYTDENNAQVGSGWSHGVLISMVVKTFYRFFFVTTTPADDAFETSNIDKHQWFFVFFWGGMRPDKSDWKANVDFGHPNITASLSSSCPRCSLQNPTLQVIHQLFWISCPAARIPSACFIPRVPAEHKGAFWGTSLSVHDPSNRYKPVHVLLDAPYFSSGFFYMVGPCCLWFQILQGWYGHEGR